MEIAIVVADDAYADHYVYPFDDTTAAIAFARRLAHEHSEGDIDETSVEGTLYHAVFSDREDRVWVIARPLNPTAP